MDALLINHWVNFFPVLYPRLGKQSKQPTESKEPEDIFTLFAEVKELRKIVAEQEKMKKEVEKKKVDELKEMVEKVKQMKGQVQRIKIEMEKHK